MVLLCAYGALQRRFCFAGEADLQDYAPAQKFVTEIFLHTIITARGAQADAPCSRLFYDEFDYCRCFALL